MPADGRPRSVNCHRAPTAATSLALSRGPAALAKNSRVDFESITSATRKGTKLLYSFY